jgi:hypothetical protein
VKRRIFKSVGVLFLCLQIAFYDGTSAAQSTDGLPRAAQISTSDNQSPTSNWAPETNGLQLSLAFSKLKFVKGEPIAAELKLKNVSDQALHINETLQIEDFRFTIVHEKIGPVPLTEYGERRTRDMIVNWNSVRTLAPGEALENTHRISAVWDLSRPGKYRITASRIASRENWQELKKQGASKGKMIFYIPSNAVEIEVVSE